MLDSTQIQTGMSQRADGKALELKSGMQLRDYNTQSAGAGAGAPFISRILKQT